MATKKISALNSIGTIDPANDVLPIVDVSLSTTNKVTPNALFGITGSVVGTSDSQSLTNKTLGNTNTIVAKDTLLTLQDDGDATKQAQFQLSGITTGNTRTLTVPDASTTLVGTGTIQTLTNKTLTSPTITGGSIDNSTITVDSISGHTTSTIVTVGGVQMNNGVIGTSGAVTTTSIAAGAVVPNSLFASTGSGWAWQTWSPTLTNLTLGNGTQIAKYVQVGKTVFFRYALVLGTTSAVGSNPTISPPVAPNTDYGTPGGEFIIGQGEATCAGADYYLMCEVLSSTTLRALLAGTASSFLGGRTALTASVPGVWTTGNFFSLVGSFEAA